MGDFYGNKEKRQKYYGKPSFFEAEKCNKSITDTY